MTTFNLSRYLNKTAGANDLAEKQLRPLQKNKAPSNTTETQLESQRSGKEADLIEKQLPHSDKPATEVTEVQLTRKEQESKSITQKQLDPQRKNAKPEDVTEKQLGSVRTAAKQSKEDQPTESKLESDRKKAPQSITEVQVEKDRKENPNTSIESQLEKARTGAADSLTEHRLDTSKSKLVKHRNPEASAGDINKLEEQRLKNDPVEQQKPQIASKGRSSKDLNKGKGQKVASADFPIRMAGSDDDIFEEQFGQDGIAGLLQKNRQFDTQEHMVDDFFRQPEEETPDPDENQDNLSPEAKQELESADSRHNQAVQRAADIYEAFSFEAKEEKNRYIKCIIRFDAAQMQETGLLTVHDTRTIQGNPQNKQQSPGIKGIREYAFQWLKDQTGRELNNREGLPAIKEMSKADLSQVTISADDKLSGYGRLSFAFEEFPTKQDDEGNWVGDVRLPIDPNRPPIKPEQSNYDFEKYPPVPSVGSDGSKFTINRLGFKLRDYYNADSDMIEFSTARADALRWMLDNDPRVPQTTKVHPEHGELPEVTLTEDDLDLVDTFGRPFDRSKIKFAGPDRNGIRWPEGKAFLQYVLPDNSAETQGPPTPVPNVEAPAPQLKPSDSMEMFSATDFKIVVKS
jgi:hypothetical protein